MRKIVLVLILIHNIVFSQDEMNPMNPFSNLPTSVNLNTSKYGVDTVRCEENLTIYNEFYKQKSYNSAINAWLYLFINAHPLIVL